MSQGGENAYGRMNMIGIVAQRTGTKNHGIGICPQQSHHHLILHIITTNYPATGLTRSIIRNDAVQRLHEVGNHIWQSISPLLWYMQSSTIMSRQYCRQRSVWYWFALIQSNNWLHEYSTLFTIHTIEMHLLTLYSKSDEKSSFI